MHLKERARDEDRLRIDAILDAVTDPALAAYARLARNGELP
jgi:hypothetical protein